MSAPLSSGSRRSGPDMFSTDGSLLEKDDRQPRGSTSHNTLQDGSDGTNAAVEHNGAQMGGLYDDDIDEDDESSSFVINLDDVASRLLLPVDTISTQLFSSTHAPDRSDGNDTPESAGILRRPSVIGSPLRASSAATLSHAHGAARGASATAEGDPGSLVRDSGLSRGDAFTDAMGPSRALITSSRASGVVIRLEGSICASPDAPSPIDTAIAAESPISPTAHEPHSDATPLLPPPSRTSSHSGGGSAGAVRSPSGAPPTTARHVKVNKRVHFPENVVKSVCIVPHTDGETGGLSHELRVRYNRPWYAYALFLLANACFVAAWTEIMRAGWPDGRPGETLYGGVAVVSFTSFAFTSVFLLAYVALTWRPTAYERAMMKPTSWIFPAVARVVFYGAMAQLLLTASCMLHVTSINNITFTTVPLIATFLYEKVKQRSVTTLDTFGALMATVGLVILCVGEEQADHGHRADRFGAVACALLGGVLMAPYLTQLRQVGKDVSNSPVIATTVAVTAAAAAAIAGAAHGFTTPLGNGDDVRSVFDDLSSVELLRVMMSGAFMFFFWLFHHLVSLYFDIMSIVAGYSLCAPMVLIAYHIQGLPTMAHSMEAIGGAVVTVGCSTVVFSGWYFRMQVSIPIETDQEQPQQHHSRSHTGTDHDRSGGSVAAAAAARRRRDPTAPIVVLQK